MTRFRFLGVLAPATLALGLLAAGASATAADLTEGFEVVVPAGWTERNNSTVVGTTGWFLGEPDEFAAHAGSPSSYAAANYNNVAGTGTISNWLISPTLTFNNGDVVSFWTRTVEPRFFADRLELRFSSVAGTDVGTSPNDVGSFALLLLTVNPTLQVEGYPNAWTEFTSTITGLSGPTQGAIAFRYFVTDGGSGANSSYIGIDTLTITAVPEPATYLLMALGVGGLLLRRSRASRA